MKNKNKDWPVLSVVFNGEEALRYERHKSPSSQQLHYLKELDRKLEQGFEYQGSFMKNPDTTQKSGFMAMQLMQALIAEKDDIAAASCAWLATRLPDLKQVRFAKSDIDSNIELVFDRSLQQVQQEQVVNFVKRKPH